MIKKYKFDSEMHKSILTAKYCHNKKDESKESFDEAISRVATNVNKYDKKMQKYMTEKTLEYITNKEFAPAGGIWRSAGNPKHNVSGTNCTTQSPVKDNIEDIFGESLKDWARIASYGQGNGIDISGLRPREALVNNCAKTSSGAVSFLNNYDSVIQVIGQDARRGATKPDIWIYHPDSEEFITCKNDITKLTTQNISVKVDSKFMEAVKNDEEIELKWERKKNKVYVGGRLFDDNSEGPEMLSSKKISARYLFNKIAESAWKTGEPGIEFWDISEKLSNSNYCPDKRYHIVSTNACCVTGDTLLLTKEGNIPIKDLVDKEVEAWNGIEWSKVTPDIMGRDVEVYTVELSNGIKIDCTNNHVWIIQDPLNPTVMIRKETKDLLIKDILYPFKLPTGNINNGDPVYIVNYKYLGIEKEVYCATEPKNHTLTFNGIVTGNSEQKLDPYNTCILSSINLFKMPKFDEDWKTWLEERASFGIRFLDNVVMCELKENRYANEKQHQKIVDMTRVGLGFTGWADYLFKCNIEYGSKESMKVLEEIMKVLATTSYRTSIALGKERGSFKKFKKEWFIKSEFIKNLCKITDLKLSEFTHLRHVACMSIAPTGSLSMVVGVDGSGIEPFFAPYYTRKERATTGGEFKEHYVFSSRVKDILTKHKMEFTKENADEILKQEKAYVTVNDINPMHKMELMKIIYKYIDSGISVTYNLPKEANIQDIKDIYMKAYELGLKSVTVYRDGSREGVLTTTSSGNIEEINKHDAIKRPKELPCDIHRVTIDSQKYLLLVGKMKDEPYEIFCGLADKLDIPKEAKEGSLLKNKRGDYRIKIGDIEEDITKAYLSQASRSALTRMISMSLRHGVDVSYVVQQIEKSYGDMTSFSKVLARVLKKYIKDGTKVSGETCPSCKSVNLLRVSGCVSCQDCGWSKC